MDPAAFRRHGHALVDAANQRLMDAVTRTGRLFLSHTRIHGRFALRIAIGHQRTQHAHVRAAWDTLRTCAQSV